MLTATIATVVLAIQNPLPHSVTLPSGWHVEYSVANGRGALIGPDGEKVGKSKRTTEEAAAQAPAE